MVAVDRGLQFAGRWLVGFGGLPWILELLGCFIDMEVVRGWCWLC